MTDHKKVSIAKKEVATARTAMLKSIVIMKDVCPEVGYVLDKYKLRMIRYFDAQESMINKINQRVSEAKVIKFPTRK